VSPSRSSSSSLRPRRAVRADAALGTGVRGIAGRTVQRYAPSGLASRAGRARFPLAPPSWPESVPRPAPEHELGADYDTAWSRKYPVRLARAMLIDNVTRPLTRVIASPDIRGAEYLTDVDAPVIFAANHASHVDTALLLSSLPVRFRHRTVVAAAADYFFDRRWKADLWAFSLAAIPMERERVNRRSAALAAELLADDWNLVIFPEGGRSPDGWGQTWTPASAAYLAARTGRPVVPVHLEGTRHILPKGRSGLRRTPTTVLFGSSIRPDGGEDARKFGARIEAAVAALADEVSTDWWTARKQAASGTTPPLRGPSVAQWRRSWALPPREGPMSTSPDGNDWPLNTR
jgi:1-acyl-sn-glycerol-3-phosphate acyltransferase